MIQVDRSAVPEPQVLKKPYGKEKKTELERATEHMNGPDKDKTFEFSRYKSSEVKEALESLFHGKCAYCESYYSSTQPVDVEHYRPKGKVEGDDKHSGYWWLAMEWTNLLPSCIDCNRRRNQRTPIGTDMSMVKLGRDGDFDRSKQLATGKACAFPLQTGGVRSSGPGSESDLILEKALLLDPTRENPEDHLVFHVGRDMPISLVGPKPLDANSAVALPVAVPSGNAEDIIDGANAAQASSKGAISIQVYGLNRLGLVQARTRVLRDLEFLLEMSIRLTEVTQAIEARNIERGKDKAMVSGGRRAELEDEIRFNHGLLGKIILYRDETKAKLASMMSPEAPYSAVARTWISAFL